MVIRFISGNRNKFKEWAELLAPIEIEQLDVDLAEIQSLDSEEIIKHKLKEATQHHDGQFVVEDNALVMEALGGQLPGPLVKFFNDTVGPQGLYELAKNSGKDKAIAKSIIGYYKAPDEILFFKGEVTGRIAEPQVNYGFGFDPVFVPDGQEKCLGKLKSEGNFEFSPRGIAVKKLKEYLEKQP